MDASKLEIAQLQEQAVQAARVQDHNEVNRLILELEKIWDDNRAAKQFYTYLEQLGQEELTLC